MKILISARVGKRQRGGLKWSAYLIQRSLEAAGCQVTLHNCRTPLPKDKLQDIDIVWWYGELNHLEEALKNTSDLNIPVMVNSTYDNRHSVIVRLKNFMREWRVINQHTALTVFTQQAKDILLGHFDRDSDIQVIPMVCKTAKTPPDSPFGIRKGVFIGDLQKAFMPRVVGKYPVEENLQKIHDMGIPVHGVRQYDLFSRIPEFITRVPYTVDFTELLSQYRIMISFSQFESFGMIPIEAQSAGTPVLYRSMPQSLDSCIGETGIVFEDESNLLECVDALYHDEDLWTEWHNKSVENSKPLHWDNQSKIVAEAFEIAFKNMTE